jgi:hypothetical protein
MENAIENKNVEVASTNKGGAPIGNQNGKKGKLFYNQLRVALVQEDSRKLRTIAQKLVDAAEQGEPWAIKEVIDRVDGKAVQSTEISGLDGGILETLNTINIVLKKPNGA